MTDPTMDDPMADIYVHLAMVDIRREQYRQWMDLGFYAEAAYVAAHLHDLGFDVER